MLRLAILVVCLLLLSAAPSAAQILELEGRYWFADLDGSAQLKSGSVPGTKIDLENDLGVDDENLPEVRLTFSTSPNSRLRLAYLHGNFDGDTTLSRTIQVNGTTFSASTRVETDLDLHYGRIGWAYMFPIVPGAFRVGPLVEVKGIFLDASLKTVGPGVRESAELPMAFPTVGLMANLTPHRMLEFFAEASGIPFGDLGYILDAEAGLRFVPFRLLTISGGYRIFEVRVGESNDFGKLKLFGPFIGASLRF